MAILFLFFSPHFCTPSDFFFELSLIFFPLCNATAEFLPFLRSTLFLSERFAFTRGSHFPQLLRYFAFFFLWLSFPEIHFVFAYSQIFPFNLEPAMKLFPPGASATLSASLNFGVLCHASVHWFRFFYSEDPWSETLFDQPCFVFSWVSSHILFLCSFGAKFFPAANRSPFLPFLSPCDFALTLLAILISTFYSSCAPLCACRISFAIDCPPPSFELATPYPSFGLGFSETPPPILFQGFFFFSPTSSSPLSPCGPPHTF